MQSEANFMSLCEIKRKDDERYEMFFQRILAHIDDNLLYDLSSKSLKDIQPQLLQSMDALLAELSAQNEIQVHYTRSSRFTNKRPVSQRTSAAKSSRPASQPKLCSLCKAAGRAYQNHDISSCWHLSKFEKLEMAKTLRILTLESGEEDEVE